MEFLKLFKMNAEDMVVQADCDKFTDNVNEFLQREDIKILHFNIEKPFIVIVYENTIINTFYSNANTLIDNIDAISAYSSDLTKDDGINIILMLQMYMQNAPEKVHVIMEKKFQQVISSIQNMKNIHIKKQFLDKINQ